MTSYRDIEDDKAEPAADDWRHEIKAQLNAMRDRAEPAIKGIRRAQYDPYEQMQVLKQRHPPAKTDPVAPIGQKADGGKPRPFTLLLQGMPRAVSDVVAVLEHGAAKYGAHNWRQVPEAKRRYLDAAMRHLMLAAAGETQDADSACPHLAHAICSLLFVLELGD
jgi:hypothetical protein